MCPPPSFETSHLNVSIHGPPHYFPCRTHKHTHTREEECSLSSETNNNGTLIYMPTGNQNHSFWRWHSFSCLMPEGFLRKEAGFAHKPGCCFFSKHFPPPQRGWELYRGQTKPFLLPTAAAWVVEDFRDHFDPCKAGNTT